MSLFDMWLKLIKTLGMTSREDFNQLYADVKHFEADCLPTNKESKLKSAYGKLHEGDFGILVKMSMPILFYFVLDKMRKIMNPGSFEDDLFTDTGF